ncbi:MAG: bifunctional demethylmenaquinone methyltransferase/2-methoxy-6-polyprenyl,4-benzoquinol methylase, partial [Rickettsiaceae bacterium]|nr:bifunctional demethylmenaquinone methyltransferase/2-methoxy-6-polyprenyl,4-benzoquinol methylase [Rickettsiaceae bacterium]
MSEKTHFGFKEVDKEEKESLVKGVFSSVASKYDIMNDVMSFGVHRIWKDKFISMLAPKDGSRLLDVAGGTGDIAFRFLKSCKGGGVTVCDINPNMLEEGRKNAIDKNRLNGLEWLCGNAEKLPLPNSSYDYYTIAFGIRNVTDIPAALKEAHRVLKPGGRFMCLEFSKVENSLMANLYDFYSFKVIPQMGKLVANDSESYQYLVESIRKFP